MKVVSVMVTAIYAMKKLVRLVRHIFRFMKAFSLEFFGKEIDFYMQDATVSIP